MLRECLRTSLTIFITLGILLSGVVLIPVSSQYVEGEGSRGSSNFTEDFYMTAYMDGNKTDVKGWGSGSIELPYQKNSNLSLIGSFNIQYGAASVIVRGDYAFVGGNNELLIINISNPETPILIGSYDTSLDPTDIKIIDNCIYITNVNGLLIMNIINQNNITILGSCDTPGYAKKLFINNKHAFIADGAEGLQIINITNPQDPVLISNYKTPTYASGVSVVDNYAFVTYHYDDASKLGSYGIEVINIADLKNPILTANYEPIDYPHDIYIVGNFAYVAEDTEGGLQIINISDPLNLTHTGSCDTFGCSKGIFAVDNFAYIADGWGGLQIINISNPQSPTLAGSCDTPGYAYRIYVVDNYAYICDNEGFQIIEVKKEKNKRYKLECVARSLEIDTTNKYIYTAKLNCEDDIPPETEVEYYLTANGGENWELVTPGIDHNFNTPGNDLRWRAFLTTENGSVTPRISKISISYEYDSTAPESYVLPIEPFWRNSTNITINWGAKDNYDLTNITLFYRWSFDGITWIKWLEYANNNALSNTSQEGEFYFTAKNGDGYYEFCTVANDLSDNLEEMPMAADAIAGVDTGWPTANPPEAYGIYNNTGTVNWSWVPAYDTGSGIVGYYVRILGTIDDSEIIVDDFTTNNWYQISGLKNNKTYYCKIKAKNGAGTVGRYRNGDLVTIDTMPPYLLSILINNGENETHTLTVNLTLKATDYPSGVDQMSFSSNGVDWSSWEHFKPTKSYTLPLGNGLKTIYFKVRDKAGNIASQVSDSIILNIPESIIDTDNDGYNNTIEELIGTNPYDPNSIPADLDKDYIPDLFDPDIDGDGKLNEDDQYPYDPKKWKDDEADFEFYLTILIIAVAVMIVLIIINIKKYFRFGKNKNLE